VVAIAVIIMAWGYPKLSTLANKYRLDGAAWSLATDLQKIRLRAVGEGTPFRVVFDTGAKTYQVQKQVSGGGFTNDGSSRPIEDAGLITVAVVPSGTTPTFTTWGRMQSGTESRVDLSAPTGGVRRIWLPLQGQVYVQ
jgi:Tfp pilus assembly protein FimT